MTLVAAHGETIKIRKLLDQGSEVSLIQESLVQLLRLPRGRALVPIISVGTQHVGSTRGVVSLRLRSRIDPSVEINVSAFSLPRPIQNLRHPIAPIDIILGADVYGSFLCGSIKRGPSNASVAQETSFGWIIFGPASSVTATSCPASFSIKDINLQEELQKFWLQEEVASSTTSHLNQDELECEKHFLETHSRDSTERYIVRLPFKSNHKLLGEFRSLANYLFDKLAFDEEHHFPQAAKVLRKEKYVDDILSGADSPQEAQSKAAQLIQLLMAGGFRLQKWASNDDSILSGISTSSELSSDGPELVIIVGKIFIQHLWKSQAGWDDPLPQSLAHDWLTFEESLKGVSEISIPRWIGTSSSVRSVELHGFSDASQDALGAVLYLRTFHDYADAKVVLLAAKSKVAPVKRQTIPRLELSAAVLLARLLARELAPDARWHHVAGVDNPVDCLSRGLSPHQLHHHHLWWYGPSWLQGPSVGWPSDIPSIDQSIDLEEHPQKPVHVSTIDYNGPITLNIWRGRGAKYHNGWLAISVCFSTSAVHLETVTTQRKDSSAAYRWLTGRRGICQNLFSDCGTNFIGADATLRRLLPSGSKEFGELSHLLTNDDTNWLLNPPAAPHIGGKWETAVKSIKYHLRRTINEAVLIYEELTTFLIQIEAILNSKPLSLSRTIWKTHTGTFSHRRGTNYHPGAISLNSAHLKATSLAAHLATIITLLVPVVIEVSSTQTLNIKVASPLNTNQSWPH
ncbi:hypothetical protein RF55_7535 [Lasius niger]|uniref:Uncharacterized protein n=1 Tax=Lasius niger TaxID=67767 RepID=A0A0J7NIX6_LASNI|nr:hypothetical protein RF55_7535 [Lasius niger]